MSNLKKGFFKKGAFEMENLGWWIIALIVAGIMLAGFLILKNKDISAVEYIKNLFRFGR
ncbi:MAG: hypothetical protein AABX30_03560 [Nanoarchaeota archaeon]